jgi:hypothetical protein
MASNLILPHLDTCMPTAINLYFGVRVFDSLESFIAVQTDRNEKLLKIRLDPLDSYLMNHVRVGTNNYKRHLVFNTKNKYCGDFPKKIPNQRNRAILHYETITAPQQGHVEAITMENGVVKYLCYPEASLLPYTNMTLEDYIAKAKGSETGNAFLDMFVYRN